MSWVKLDDRFFRNRKSIAAGRDGRAMYLAGLCFCADGLTDGFIQADAVRQIAADADAPAKTVEKLVDVGYWVPVEGGYRVPDYLAYNPSRDQVLADRERAKSRQQSHRASRRDKPSDDDRSSEASHACSSEGPFPLVVTSTSPLASSTDPPGDGSIKRRCWEAALVLGHREAARRQADYPEPYARSLIPKLQAAHSAEWRRLLDTFPDLTAEQLADRTGPRDPTPSIDATQTLIDDYERAERAKPPARPSNLANLGRHRPEDAA